MWTQIRHLAFDRQTTASKIVETALQEWLDRDSRGDKPRAGAAIREHKPSPTPIARVVDVIETEHGVAITTAPWDSVVPDAVIPVIEDELRGPLLRESFVGQGAQEMVEKAAALAAQKEREFTPVPKPVRKPRPKR